nr:MAG: RNA helicase [Guiyang Dicistro-like virus 1]
MDNTQQLRWLLMETPLRGDSTKYFVMRLGSLGVIDMFSLPILNPLSRRDYREIVSLVSSFNDAESVIPSDFNWETSFISFKIPQNSLILELLDKRGFLRDFDVSCLVNHDFECSCFFCDRASREILAEELMNELIDFEPQVSCVDDGLSFDFQVYNVLSRSMIKRWRRLSCREKAGIKKSLFMRRLKSINKKNVLNFSFEAQVFEGLSEIFKASGDKISSVASAIGDVTSAIHSASLNGLSVSDDVFERLDGLTGEFKRFNAHLDILQKEGVHHSHDHSFGFKDLITWCYEHRGTIGIVMLICTVFVLCTQSRFAVIASALVALTSSLVYKYSPELVDVWETYSPRLSNMVCAYEAQVFENPVIKSALLLSYIFGFKGIDVKTLTSRFDKFCHVLGEAPRKSGDILSTIGFYFKSLQDLFNQTLAWCGSDYSINLAPEKYPDSTRLLNEVTSFLKKSAESKDLVVEQAARTSQILQARITDLVVKNKSDHEFSGDRTLLMRALNKLESYDRELDLRGAGRDVTRVPPKAYLFIGKPKIGKSYLLKSLSFMALYTILRDNEVALNHIRNGQMRDYIFTRNSSDKFWEGYYNQLLVIIDEVGMQRDTAGADVENNEYSNIIKMVNDVIYPLLMANVEKKGTREFNSSVIFGTTNNYQFQIESINNKEAFDRRLITYEVSVKPEYAQMYYGDGRTDDWMVPDFVKMKKLGLSDIDIALSRFLEFRPRRSVLSPGYSGPSIGIDDLIGRVRNDLQGREEEARMRQRQSELLHDFFDPAKRDQVPGNFGVTEEQHESRLKNLFFGEAKAAVPGTFEPQINDCICKICKPDDSRFFTDEQKVFYSTVCPDLPIESLEPKFQEAYDFVENNRDMTINRPRCILVEKKERKWDGHLLMFNHGAGCRTQYLESIDFSTKKERLEKIVSVAKKIGIALGVIVTLVSIYKIGSAFFADPSDNKEKYDTQVTDLNAQEVLSCIVKRNVYCFGDGVIDLRGFVTFIGDNIMIVPKHYTIMWKREFIKDPNYSIILRRLGDKVDHQRIKVNAKFLTDVFDFSGQDLVAVYVGGRLIQRHASIRKYLPGRSIPPKGEIVFPVVDRRDLKYDFISAPFQTVGSISYTYSGHTLKVDQPIQYRYKTSQGDCGLPVAYKDPTSRSEKICGIHAMGAPSVGVGCSVPFFQDDYDNIICHFEKKYNLIQAQYRSDPDVLLDMYNEGRDWNDLYEVPAGLEVEGKVNLGYLQPPSVPVKTSIIPSPLFKKVDFDPKTKPAWLRTFTNKVTGEVIDPNRKTTLKYHRTVMGLDMDILDICKNDVTNLIINGPMVRHHPAVPREALCFEAAVAGIPGVEGLDGMPRKTSAGYPRCMSVEKRGKRDFFGEDGDYVFTTPAGIKIRLTVETIIDSAKKGIRLFHVFLDFPKDERRPCQKVDDGKTRKISACPIELSIAVRILFGSFIQFFMYNRIYNQSAVGVNVFDSQWELIAQYLGTDKRIIAGDFGNYDGSLTYPLMVRFLDTVTEYYNDRGTEFERAREVIFQEMVNSRHIMDGVIYEWVGSNASGNPLTTVLNSWCNLVLLRYATLKVVDKCTPREATKFLKSMDKDIRFMVYGDDNIISVNRDSPYSELLVQDNYTKAFEEMGLEYTDENKTGLAISQDRSIEDVSFLKRKWAKNSVDPRRIYLSPLAIETIMESIQWTKRKDYSHDHVKDNCVNMLQELSQHSREIFDQYAPKIVKACKEEMGFSPVPNTYEECQALVLARDNFF